MAVVSSVRTYRANGKPFRVNKSRESNGLGMFRGSYRTQPALAVEALNREARIGAAKAKAIG